MFQFTGTVGMALLPAANIDRSTFRICVRTLSLTQIKRPLSLVRISIDIGILALTLFLVLEPFTFVY